MALLSLLKDMLPEDNELKDHTYDAKKILCFMSLYYKRIHNYANDCILYRKNYAGLESCPICEVDIYKKSKLVIPRFIHMFINAEHLKNLLWCSDGRSNDNMLRHPAD